MDKTEKIKCIYTITNVFTNEKYVGSTSDFEARKKRHFSCLENGTHNNWKMQKDYFANKECLRIEILSLHSNLNSAQLYDLEQGYINLGRYGYNLTKFTSKRNAEGKISNILNRAKKKFGQK